jgi:hypothetical protein
MGLDRDEALVQYESTILVYSLENDTVDTIGACGGAFLQCCLHGSHSYKRQIKRHSESITVVQQSAVLGDFSVRLDIGQRCSINNSDV